MAKTNKKKIVRERPKVHTYIRILNDYAARVIISEKPWNEIFDLLSESIEYNEMKKNGIVAFGDVEYDENTASYYGTDTMVRKRYKRMGFGIRLYKALMIAAAHLDKIRKRNGKIYFSPHEAIGCVTSNSAWRVYKSLYRCGYLGLKRGKNPKKKSIFFIKRMPIKYKPIIYRCDGY